MYYSILARAALLVLALWWCKVVIGRLGKDIEEFRTSDYTGKIPVVVIWFLTILVILWLIGFVWKYVRLFSRYL